LNLCKCQIGDEGAAALAFSLMHDGLRVSQFVFPSPKKPRGLKTLKLQKNNISNDHTAGTIADMLLSNTTLTLLTLTGNPIKPQGKDILKKALKRNVTLTQSATYFFTDFLDDLECSREVSKNFDIRAYKDWPECRWVPEYDDYHWRKLSCARFGPMELCVCACDLPNEVLSIIFNYLLILWIKE